MSHKLLQRKRRQERRVYHWTRCQFNDYHHWFTREGEEQHPNSILMQSNRGESSGEGKFATTSLNHSPS